MTQRGEDPPLDHLHADLGLGLVARPPYPGGDDGEAVVLGQLGVGGVGVGLVAMGAGDGQAQVDRRNATTISGTPWRKLSARTCEAHQSGNA